MYLLLSALFLQSLLLSGFNQAVGDTFDIVTSLETLCPGEFSGVPCLTLQQYVSNPSISGNVTLLFETGNHTLGSVFSASSAMKYSLSGDNVNIKCVSSTAQLNFQSIQEVYISGINFWRCHGGIILANIVTVTISNSAVQYSDGYSTDMSPVTLLHVGNCCIFNSAFRHNRGNKGGVMRATNSTVNVHNSVFQYNSANWNGGVIYAQVVLITNSTFSNNRANQQGGAIYTTSYVHCRESTFVNNTATNYGGGIYVTGTNSSLSVHQSSFTGNTASALGGGAIYSNSRYSNVTISESIFSYNSASYCSVLDVDEFYHFNVSITDSVFTYNMATGRLVGGGVACIRNASISILRSSFQHNQATLHGGVFHIDASDVLVDESVFVNNSASEDGGVFYTYVHLSHYNIRRSEFSYNSAGDDGGVMFIGRVNSRVNISECVFSFNIASGRGGVAALIGSTMYLQLNNIFNNTAEYGGIISACNSVVIVMEDALFMTPDPVYSFCILYNGHIVHYHISPPVDPELTPSPSTTQQTMSSSFDMVRSKGTLDINQNLSTNTVFEILLSSTKLEVLENSYSEIHSTETYSISITRLSNSMRLSSSDSMPLSFKPGSSLASTQHTHSTNVESFSELFSTSTLKASLITTTHYNMEASTTMLPTPSLIEPMPTRMSQHSEQLSLFSSTDYLTSLEPETLSDFSLSSLTLSPMSMLNTYLDPNLPQSGAVTSLSTMKSAQSSATSQSNSHSVSYTESAMTILPGHNSYSSRKSFESASSEAKFLVEISKTITNPSLESTATMDVSTHTLKVDLDEATEVPVNSDIHLKLNMTMAVSIGFFGIIVVVLFVGVIAILMKVQSLSLQKQSTQMYELKSQETAQEMKDNASYH